MTKRKTNLARRNPSSFGSIEQRGSRFRAYYRHEGRKISAPHTFPTHAAARAWLIDAERKQLSGGWHDPAAGLRTLREYADSWIDSRTDLAPRTADTYRRALDRWILPTLGEERLDSLTPAKIRAWYGASLQRAKTAASADPTRSGPQVIRVWARGQGLEVAATGRLSPRVVEAWKDAGSPIPGAKPKKATDGSTAVAAAYRVLRTVLGAAERDEVIDRNPCRIRGAGSTKTKERRPATPEQVRALAAAMPPHLSAAVLLAAWSGLRFGELFALARRHIDLESGVVVVTRSLVRAAGGPPVMGPTKTASSRRTVSLPGFVVDALRSHLDEFVADDDPDALVFTLSNGSPMRNERLSRLFGRAREAVGLPDLRWHDLRHTGASLAYRAGAAVPDVQRRLGHSTMRAAQIYAHAYDDADKLVADRLDAMFAQSR